MGQVRVSSSERLADETDRIESSERLRCTAQLAIDPGSFNVDGRAGMLVKVVIITGQHRIVDFLLSPLREHVHDALRER